MGKEPTTAIEVAAALATGNPTLMFATEPKDSVVGVWSAEANRYIGVAARTITGEWCLIPEGLALVNGEPVVSDHEWIPFTGTAIPSGAGAGRPNQPSRQPRRWRQ